MKRLHGIRLPLRKHAEDQKVEAIPLPELIRIPLSVPTGTACTTAFQPDDRVYVGQVIGLSGDTPAIPVHASVSGTVTALTSVQMPDGKTVPCVEIKPDGKQVADAGCKPPVIESRETLIQAVLDSGCAGVGGLDIVNLPSDRKLNMLIVSGVECEPHLAANSRLMIEHAGDIIGGIRLLMKHLKIKSCRIGLENNQAAALKGLAYACGSDASVQVIPLPPLYPQRAERVLIYHTTGRVLPEGSKPADIGVLILNATACMALYQYSKTGIPMTERVVTVDGDAVRRPCNLRVPLGTPQKNLLKFAGIDEERVAQLIAGGTMTGINLKSDEVPVTKQQNALLALSKVSQPAETGCIRCGRCMKACPMNLMPMLLDSAFQKQNTTRLKKLHISQCMNCGCCTYVCPSKRPLAERIRQAKQLLAAENGKEANA